jgi:hypothetical protein
MFFAAREASFGPEQPIPFEHKASAFGGYAVERGGPALWSVTLQSPAGMCRRPESPSVSPPIRVTIVAAIGGAPVAAPASAWPALLSGVGPRARSMMGSGELGRPSSLRVLDASTLQGS